MYTAEKRREPNFVAAVCDRRCLGCWAGPMLTGAVCCGTFSAVTNRRYNLPRNLIT